MVSSISSIDLEKSRALFGTGGPAAPAIFVINSTDHPFALEPLTHELTSTLVSIAVSSWNDALTPWPAPSLYREEQDFGGKAPETLLELRNHVIPAIEQREGLTPRSRAICGYSLGGLFSLYAFTHGTAFSACGCLSGSVWYEGWVDHLRSLDLQLDGKFAFLSLGSKERRGAHPAMRTVQDNMQLCANALQDRGCKVHFEVTPGNHFQHVDERLHAGISALDAFLIG